MYMILNGEIIDARDAKISPFDHGFMYGLGVFETFPIYGDHPFLLDDHLTRLTESLHVLNIDWSCSRDSLVQSLISLKKTNQFDHAYVRLNVSAGVGELGLSVDPYQKPTTIIYMKELPIKKTMNEKTGVFLSTRRNTPEGQERLKSHHYFNNILGKREIGNDLSKEGIFLTERGYLAEGVVSNLFWIKGNVVYTPSLQTGILNGVTRQFVMTLSEKLGFEVKQGLFKPSDLLNSEEAFVTNSIQEIVPLISIKDQMFPGQLGCKTAELYDLYQQYKNSLWSKYELEEG